MEQYSCQGQPQSQKFPWGAGLSSSCSVFCGPSSLPADPTPIQKDLQCRAMANLVRTLQHQSITLDPYPPQMINICTTQTACMSSPPVMSLPRLVSAASRSSRLARSASREETQPVLKFEQNCFWKRKFRFSPKNGYKNERIYLHLKKLLFLRETYKN